MKSMDLSQSYAVGCYYIKRQKVFGDQEMEIFEINDDYPDTTHFSTLAILERMPKLKQDFISR